MFSIIYVVIFCYVIFKAQVSIVVGPLQGTGTHCGLKGTGTHCGLKGTGTHCGLKGTGTHCGL